MADKEKPTPWRRLSDACMEKESVFLHRGDAVRHPGSAFGLLLVAEKMLGDGGCVVPVGAQDGRNGKRLAFGKQVEAGLNRTGDRLELGHLEGGQVFGVGLCAD